MKNILRFAALFCLATLCCALCASALEKAQIKDEYTFDGKSLSEYSHINGVPEIDGYSAYVINLDTGTVVYEKKSGDKVYPASTVKLMTAIVAYENIPDLNVQITVSENAVKQASGSNMSLKAGEVLTARDLLCGVLITGANDAALMLAEYVGTTQKDFCAMMNDKAKEIGADDTNFDNVTGFHVDTTVTTARDMAIIARYLYYIDELFEMTNTTRYVVEPTNKTGAQRTLVNRNLLISRVRAQNYYYQGAKGLSLGGTPEGGQCIASTVTSPDGLTYLCVVMNSKETEDENFACKDVTALFDFCLASFSLQTVESTKDVMCEIPVKLAVDTDHLTLFPENDIKVLLPTDMVYDEDITVEKRVYNESAKAPVYKGNVFGEIVVMYKGEAVVGRTKLVAQTSVDRSNILYFLSRIEGFVSGTWFKVFLGTAVVLFVLYFCISVYISVKRKRYGGRRKR